MYRLDKAMTGHNDHAAEELIIPHNIIGNSLLQFIIFYTRIIILLFRHSNSTN